MENILCLLGGAVLGAIIYASATRKQNNSHEIKRLLHKILSKLDSEDAAELEKQMDSWLATLGKSIGAIEKVSDHVDSKQVSK